ncbi:MAG: HPP family protein [Bilophila wadsworthia]
MNRNISLASRDPLPLGREDIYKGMEELGAYLDVTPRDFQEIYAHAYKIARGRLLSSITAGDIMHVPVLCVAEEQSVRDLVIFSTIIDFRRARVGAEGRLRGRLEKRRRPFAAAGDGDGHALTHADAVGASGATLSPCRFDHDASASRSGRAYLGDMPNSGAGSTGFLSSMLDAAWGSCRAPISMPLTCMRELLRMAVASSPRLMLPGNLLRVGWEPSGHRLHRAVERYATGNSGFPLLIGSFGASAVLAFGAIRSPLAQPRNLVGGHFLSALVGVSCYFLFPGTPWLASCLAVATAIALMHVTKTLHPPGGATALIAVTGGEGIHQLGYLYAFVLCLLGH